MQRQIFRTSFFVLFFFFLAATLLLTGVFYLELQNQYEETTLTILQSIPTESYTGSELYHFLKTSTPGICSIIDYLPDGSVGYEEATGEKVEFTQTVTTADSVCIIGFHNPNRQVILIRLLPFCFALIIIIPFLCYFLSASLSSHLLKPIYSILRQHTGATQKTARQFPELHPVSEYIFSLEQKLKTINNQYQKTQDTIRLIQEYMVESIVILDDSDKIMLANNSAVSLLEIDNTDWEHKSIFVLTNHTPFLSAISKSKTTPSVQVLLDLKDQQFQAFINRIKMSSNYGTIILLVDVTESKKAEKIRRDFTANVSHELKTPLTTIKGFGEMFSNGMISNSEDVKKYGAMIYRESERLLFLINDIMRLSEIEEQTDQIMEDLPLYEIATDTIHLLSSKIEQTGITVNLHGARTCHMKGNENYIRELFINLIDNAVKYNNPNGIVDITLAILPNHIQIKIQDTGIGIPEQAQSRIFERFYRVDKSRSKERGGTGLGLSIVKHIVELYHGTISLNSKLGAGTTITILFPCD